VRLLLGRRERAFVLGALLHRELDRARLLRLVEAGFDWTALASAAERLGLAPVVASAAIEAGVLSLAPVRVAEALEASLHANAARNAGLVALAARAAGLLAARGVEAVALKGAALLLRDPMLIPLRVIADIDLLVRRDDLERSTATLVEAGWRLRPASVRLDPAGAPLPPEDGRHDLHHGVPLGWDTGMVLELHHALPSSNGRPRDPGEAFFRRAEPLPWRRHVVKCPPPDDLLAVACEHVIIHHRYDPVHLPRLVLDLQTILDAGARQDTIRQAWGADVAGAVEKGLRLLEEARAGARRPTLIGRGRVERALSPLWRWTWGVGERMFGWRRLPHHVAGLLRQYGWRALFPSAAYMANRYGVAPRSPLILLLYLWRPFRKAISLLTGR
jgi:hypothetical protein